DLRLDGEGAVVELAQLAELPLELPLGVVAGLLRQRLALPLEFGEEVLGQAREAEEFPPLRDRLHLPFELRDRVAQMAQLLIGERHPDDALEEFVPSPLL